MHRTKIAVPIVQRGETLEAQFEAALRAGADLVELRVDLIDDVDAVETFLGAHVGEERLIVTVRSADEGGAWDDSEADRVALIERLGLYRPGYVDVEWATWRRSENVRQKIGLVCDTTLPLRHARGAPATAGGRQRSRLILSHHDFKQTPANLAEVFDDLLRGPAAVHKAAFATRDARDSFRLLAELGRCAANGAALVALGMGEGGLPTRVLAGTFGAPFTFATLDAAQASAPGQPTLNHLLHRYRWASLNGETRAFGVVGWPVRHSRSPEVHNAAMHAEGVNGVYLPLPVEPTYADFASFMETAAAPELRLSGLSVTIPHKEHALQWVRERNGDVSELAATIGAVNTLTLRDGVWSGDNTDAAGVMAALHGAGMADLRGVRVEVLGAGGAARAAAAATRQAGAHVAICNRTRARAARLAEELDCRTHEWDARCAADTDVMINCTSLGMTPEVDETPVPASRLRPDLLVFDTVYTPAETRLLREAAAAGARVASGVEMFIGQAAAQYAQWHGRGAPLQVMRETLRAD